MRGHGHRRSRPDEGLARLARRGSRGLAFLGRQHDGSRLAGLLPDERTVQQPSRAADDGSESPGGDGF